jgi:hypothetical protein
VCDVFEGLVEDVGKALTEGDRVEVGVRGRGKMRRRGE